MHTWLKTGIPPLKTRTATALQIEARTDLPDGAKCLHPRTAHTLPHRLRLQRQSPVEDGPRTATHEPPEQCKPRSCYLNYTHANATAHFLLHLPTNANRQELLVPADSTKSGKRDSNSRPQPWQGCALPTELFPQTPVKRGRLELPRRN